MLFDLFPESSHVSDLNLDRSTDQNVWRLSGELEFCIVTKDSDFADLLSLQGYPPKIIWIRRGNCATHEIEELLRDRHPTIEAFGNDNETGLLILQ